ncbi:hypothetical protein [Hyphomonas oceanitis]|uniref:Lipoprotein n=1 Tax=Hyphomonas oceanitis SCH89 TaxID=1280953 RepID=A0A059G6N6_9PROT|nr:hypothetical protein [Hyphomonas oceanitis]KDA02250.1 hypothetical protein HOC_11823 [Hyphomonas oceanitis SCH89]
MTKPKIGHFDIRCICAAGLSLAVLLPGCASSAPGATGAATPKSRLAAYTIIGKEGEACTATPAKSGPETVLLDLFAPFAIELAKNGLDELGTAIQAVSEAKTVERATSSSPMFLAQSKFLAADALGADGNPVGRHQYNVAYSSRCIHAIVVDEVAASQLAPATTRITPVDISKQTKAGIDSAIRTSVQPHLPATITTIRFYAAFEMRLDETSAFRQVYYNARPALLYYNQSVAGRDFKLGAVTLQLDAAWDPGKSMWTYPLLLAGNPMTPGEVRIEPLPDGLLLSAPTLSPEDIKGIQAIRDTVVKLNTAMEATDAVKSLQSRSDALAKTQSELVFRKCEMDHKGKRVEIDYCKDTATAGAEATALTQLKTETIEETALLKKGISLANPRDRDGLGAYNATVVFSETRDANAFGLSVAKALKSAKAAQDTAVTNYLNGQLGVTADASTLLADNAYRLSRFDYDQAIAAYEKAKTAGDASDIAAKQRALIVAYNDLLTKAEGLTHKPNLPPAPY